MDPTTPGIVYLVGAGPSDPQLLTLRGARLLELADVVVYDYLANPRLLSYCPQAEKIYVGKVGSDHTLSQDQINALLVEKARGGKRVVRLKGGDPFVFGRGGEECEILAREGIRFEVVPGITAGIAAPGYAGIPVTHRDFNSSITFVTGHERDDEPAMGVDYAVLARLPCVVFYMGVKSLSQICLRLVDNGMAPDTPAATVQWGASPRQRTVVGTVSDLPQRVADAKLSAPAITIVGRVVEVRDRINWFETRPLYGQTIAVTRSRPQASELAMKLEELGARVIEAPTIEIHPPDDWDTCDDALRRAAEFDWVIFTSANGVRAARERLTAIERDARTFGTAKLAAIGQPTADAIRDLLCLRVDLCPEQFVADALADALAERGQIAGKRFLLLRAEIAREVLVRRLQDAGAAEVRDVAIYQTRPARELPRELLDGLAEGHIDWITFTSSSTVRNLLALLGSEVGSEAKKILATVRTASVGPVTSQTLRDAGLEPTVEARRHTVDGLVEAIVRSRPAD